MACLACALLLSVLTGCSGQGEGNVCDVNAGNKGNDDCQTGLVCTTQLPAGVMGARCCPADRSQATTAVCSANQATLDANPAPPGSDAAADQASDSSPDQTSDATADQASDSGPEQTSDAHADQASDATADQASDSGPDQTSDATADQTSDSSPDQTSDAHADQASDATADQASESNLPEAAGQ